MQTFLPYPDDRASAAVLDDKRLGKQRVETLQILRALTWHTYGWRNHPAVRMWRGFVPALVSYGAAVCDEWVARGRADAVRPVLLEFTGGHEPSPQRLHDLGQRPPWLGLDALHLSHRSALVRKDPELYRTAFPDAPDDLPYFWPAPVFARWPVRRAQDDPLPLRAAVTVAGAEELVPDAERAIGSLAEGRSADLAGGGLDQLHATAVVAGLTTAGRTVWVLPGDPPPVPGPPPPPAEHLVSGSAVSGSIARPPQPEDRQLVEQEVAAAADPEFRFLRVPQVLADGGRALDGVGLVVVDPAVAVLPELPRRVPVLQLRLTSA